MIEDKEFFENGGFSPEWATDAQPVEPPQTKVQFKDEETLLKELHEIKERDYLYYEFFVDGIRFIVETDGGKFWKKWI